MTEPTARIDSDLEALAQHPTQSSRRDAIIAGYREQMLMQLTPRWQWALIAITYLIAITVSGVVFAHSPIILIAVIIAINIAAWWGYSQLRKRDRHYATLATLTPVVDRSVLVGQVEVLKASFQNLLSSISKPVGVETRSQAINLVTNAAVAIMDRGGVTIMTAQVDGYPPYPEIDQTSLPGSDGDYLTVPLSRIEATIARLERVVTADVILSESIAQIAGEIIPPLRSVEAVIIG